MYLKKKLSSLNDKLLINLFFTNVSSVGIILIIFPFFLLKNKNYYFDLLIINLFL